MIVLVSAIGGTVEEAQEEVAGDATQWFRLNGLGTGVAGDSTEWFRFTSTTEWFRFTNQMCVLNGTGTVKRCGNTTEWLRLTSTIKCAYCCLRWPRRGGPRGGGRHKI